jgi:hypothetical protein
VVDIVSPGLLDMLNQRMGDLVRAAGAPYVFGPPEGPPFFERCGWKPIEVRSMLKSAAKLGRLPMLLRIMALLPESARAQGSRPWAAVCLLARA